jgi:Beta xylosidase C-terminal Concanavalin A-like domain
MTDLNNDAFINLFKESYLKCFGYPLTVSMSETESKHFANKIFEDTGLVIGAKSIKNYSLYVLNAGDAKQENPSVATLDTLARYLLNAPYTDEVKRKANEGHYPYWFQYKSKMRTGGEKELKKGRVYPNYLFFIPLVVLMILFLLIRFTGSQPQNNFTDDFHSLQNDSLEAHGWFVKSVDTTWWNRRNENPGELTLFTLRGDNWTDSINEPGISNLLLTKITSDCFSAEVHMNNFMPVAEWEQAGILLMEDTTFKSKCIRLSVAYNDFFGGYKKPKEIIIQAISTGGKGYNRPEETIHLPVFNIESSADSLLKNNMQNSGLRIEKSNGHFRFLYSISPSKNFAFKEALNPEIDFKPGYVGIFALKGFVNDTNYIPVRFNFFSLLNTPCEK